MTYPDESFKVDSCSYGVVRLAKAWNRSNPVLIKRHQVEVREIQANSALRLLGIDLGEAMM